MTAWYVLLVGLGWAALPLAWRVFPRLADRGFGLARVLGLLLWGFVFWFPAALGFLPANDGWAVASLGVVLAGSALAGRGHWRKIGGWIREHRMGLLAGEALFFVVFLLAAALRGADPAAVGTEKPMEIAFINAILNTAQFPPPDPWLAGYGISYYYFGYVLVSLLARLSGVSGAVAFNLGTVSSFALAALAAYSLGVNLLTDGVERKFAQGKILAAALLAPLMILVMGNLGGLMESLTSAGVFWGEKIPQMTYPAFPPVPDCLEDPAVTRDSAFWRWLDVREWNCPPTQPYAFEPTRSGWWWWRSSRVLGDYTLANDPKEIIDEFPAFSFVLGDLHPHVLSIPFVLLAVALALQRYRRLRDAEDPPRRSGEWKSTAFWLEALCLGGLAFLNFWDFPIYWVVLLLAEAAARFQKRGTLAWEPLWLTLQRGLFLAVAAFALYLPFHLGFSSQAAGIIPSLAYFTRGIHLWLMFAPLWIPLAGWLVWKGLLQGRGRFGLLALRDALVLVGGLWGASYALGALALAHPVLAPILSATQGVVQDGDLLADSLIRRLVYPGGWITLFLFVWLLCLVLRQQITPEADTAHLAGPGEGGNPSSAFGAVLALAGIGLVLFPEFFYLRDQFGWRMNTIFKFYYQAWILLGLASSWALANLLLQAPGKGKWFASLASGLALIGLGAGLLFPWFAFGERIAQSIAQGENWTLDGMVYLQRYQPLEYEAIAWLRDAPDGVLVEAVGGSYQTEYARFSALSGKQALLGWPGHESQWRGGYTEMGNRETEIQALYQGDWAAARDVLDTYAIRYVIVGPQERMKYGARLGEEKFREHLALVFENDQVRIYLRDF